MIIEKIYKEFYNEGSQSDGDVLLDKIAFNDEDNILDQIYEKQI